MTCFPNPISWTLPNLDGAEYDLVDRRTYDFDISVLYLRSATEKHRGEYYCRGNNWKEFVTLTVLGKI